MHLREYKPDQFFRAYIDRMDDFDDFKTCVAEYFCLNIPRHGEAVFTDLDNAEEFLFEIYVQTTPEMPPSQRRVKWLRTNALS
jgi:hypothetical protein